MARATLKLTQFRIRKLPPGKIHFDVELKGFGVRVRKQRDGRRIYT